MVAIALELHTNDTIDQLVSADSVMVTLARIEGLPVINPLDS